MDLNKLIDKRIEEYALDGDSEFLDKYGFLFTMIAKEYAEAIAVAHSCTAESEQLKAFKVGDEVICWGNTFAKILRVKLTGYVCEDLVGFTFLVDNEDVKERSL